jgi:HEAT repeat protein
MLCLLRECGDRSVLKHIKPFCESGDFRIVMEAMKAFLHFQDNGGMHHIKKYLASSDAEVRDQTVKMIGSFRVKLLVPDLIKLLLKKDLLGGDFHLKIPIVRALGEIGDERAIRYLQDICMTKSLLYKGSLGMLKTEIYKSLKNYPFPAIKHLVDEGMNSKNEEIIGLCRRIMDFYGKTEKQEKT